MFSLHALELFMSLVHAATVVATTTDGRVLALDAEGVVLAEEAGGFVDVAADPDDPARFWALAPGGDEAGVLVRFRVEGHALVREREEAWEPPGGVVLFAGPEPVTLVLGEGQSLGFASGGGATPMVASAGGAGRALWTFTPQPSPRVTRRLLGAKGLEVLDQTTVDGLDDPTSARAAWTPSGVRIVAAEGGLVRLLGTDAAVAASGVVEDAVAGPDGVVLALLGPSPRLARLADQGSTVTALPGGDLPHAPWVTHRLAVDRLGVRWIALDDRAMRGETELAAPVSSIAALGRGR